MMKYVTLSYDVKNHSQKAIEALSDERSINNLGYIVQRSNDTNEGYSILAIIDVLGT